MIQQQPETPDQSVIVEASKQPNWVPWTTQQVFHAVLLTLIPWIVFNLVLNTTGGNTTIDKPLSFSDDLTGGIVAFIFTALIEGVFLIAPYYYAMKTLPGELVQEAKSRVRTMAKMLGLRRFNLAHALPWIVGLMVLIIGVNMLYSYAITALHLNLQTNSEVILQQSPYAPLTTYALLAGSVLLAPFCEELFFRGFLFTGLLHELSPAWAILISASLFAVAHVDPSSFIPLLAIGLALGFLRWRTGSTWAGMSLHALNNLLSSTLIILAMHHINIPLLT